MIAPPADAGPGSGYASASGAVAGLGLAAAGAGDDGAEAEDGNEADDSGDLEDAEAGRVLLPRPVQAAEPASATAAIAPTTAGLPSLMTAPTS